MEAGAGGDARGRPGGHSITGSAARCPECGPPPMRIGADRCQRRRRRERHTWLVGIGISWSNAGVGWRPASYGSAGRWARVVRAEDGP